MHVRGIVKISIFLVILAFFSGCDGMDTFLPSASPYKLNAHVNGVPMSERSFVVANEEIYPYFEESVSGDPDVTALMVFLRNSRGEQVGERVLYSLDGEAAENEKLVYVRALSGNLPSFPLPANLPVGRYTLVYQVMSARDVLQRTEKAFFYLGNTVFSFEGIYTHLPGIIDNPQLIPTGTVVMVEAKVDFGSHLDPYIVWYNGRRKISEGKFSDGAGYLFWKAPEQSGFFSLQAEIYPVENYDGLSGYQKEITMLVSSKTMDTNLVSENISQLMYWYLFEGNLYDSKMNNSSAERALKSISGGRPQWMPANGTYGLATGYDNIVALPNVMIPGGETNTWQTLFCIKPLNDGIIFYAPFGSSSDVFMDLSVEGQFLILTLSSPSTVVSQSLRLPDQNSFFIAGVTFSVRPGLLSANINILGDSVEQGGNSAALPIQVEADTMDSFHIFLGHKPEANSGVGDLLTRNRQVFTAIWNEFAIYNSPPMDIIAADVYKTVSYLHHGLSYNSNN